jgi:hypothetical protein
VLLRCRRMVQMKRLFRYKNKMRIKENNAARAKS